jgi:tetratricopeptide (TPR) repeat protein
MNTDYKFDVFLAHHSGDKLMVRQISNKLKQRRLKPWIDEEQIAPGRSFQQAIQQAIPTVKTAAIILGANGIGRWQEWEIETFFRQFVEKREVYSIPVLLPGVDEVPESLPFLRGLRWISFSSPEDTTALGLLIWGITGKKPDEELKERSPSKTSTETIQPSSFDADTCYNQATAQYELKNYQAAIYGFTQVIQLKPNYTDAYVYRGLARSALGDKPGAIADYQQAATLYQKQGKTSDYQDALNQIQKLQDSEKPSNRSPGLFQRLFGG